MNIKNILMQLNLLMCPGRKGYTGFIREKMLCGQSGEEGKDGEDPGGEYLLYQEKKQQKTTKTFL